MNKLFLKRLTSTVILFLISPFLWAQAPDSTASSIDDTMRSHDKIYVVMAVCIVILAVFFLYLIRIDRKVSKKEKLM
ncbi:MAG: CcmD family protein [Bacteroidota bacterium]|nr:CcmD family protein [Bacteroidota bacterium]